MGKAHWFLLLLVLLIVSVYAQESQPVQVGLSNSDKAYLDGLNQKTVAQLSAKIDAQSNAVEKTLRTEVDSASERIKQEIVAEIKSALKSIVIGLGGVIIVVLAVFRLVEYRLNHTKRIKKYEAELDKKTKEFDENLKKAQEQLKDNNILKNELRIYKESLDKYAVSLGLQPQTSLKQIKPTLPPPIQKKSLKGKIFYIILFLLILIVAGYLIYINFLTGARLN